jgi:hypothetical protein
MKNKSVKIRILQAMKKWLTILSLMLFFVANSTAANTQFLDVSAGNAARASSKIAVQFGKTENQIYHAFRHTDALGLDRSLVQSTIQNHFKTVSSQVVAGKPFNQIIEIGGQRIQYSAFKLSDGTFNIGRIHGVK